MIKENSAGSLEAKVYSSLEEDILSGKYRSGEAITEASITSELGVSRTPVREALHRLEKEGLVRLIPNKGAVVIGVSVEDLIDIYKIRMRLEGLAARIAAESMAEEDKKLLRDNIELAEFYLTKSDAENVKNLDSGFHDYIYRASGSRMIYKILSELHHNIKAYRKLSLTAPERQAQSVEEHKKILDAIIRADADEADALSSRHVEMALDNLLKILKANGTIE